MKIVNEEINIIASQSKIPFIDEKGNVSYVNGTTNKLCLSVKHNDGVSIKNKKNIERLLFHKGNF